MFGMNNRKSTITRRSDITRNEGILTNASYINKESLSVDITCLEIFTSARMTTLAIILSLVTISESQAACSADCLSCEAGGSVCALCKDGMVPNGTNCKTCASDEVIYNNSCAKICADDEERYGEYNGLGFIYSCLKKCASDEFRKGKTCHKIPTCENGSICRNGGTPIPNCCYKTEGDTTILYPDNPELEYEASSVMDLPDNKKLVLSAGANDYFCPRVNSGYEELYLPEGMNIPSGCHCCYGIPSDFSVIVPDDVDMKNVIQNDFNIVCLGDIKQCKKNVTSNKVNRVVSPTESQCNGSGTYYFTGSECLKRPVDGADITCDYDFKGYVKVGDYCASPENTYAKKHYTPAEAAQWLHDGNDNFVVITFKK